MSGVPTELVLGADPIVAFVESTLRSRSTLRRATSGEAASTVTDLLAGAGARSAVLASDLGPYSEPIRTACAEADIACSDAAAIARIAEVDASVTGCSAALAPTGSILTTAVAGRSIAVLPPLHVCIVRTTQILSGLRELFERWPTLGVGSLGALQTGPSRTADIGMVSVLGAHGPRAVAVVLIDDSSSRTAA